MNHESHQLKSSGVCGRGSGKSAATPGILRPAQQVLQAQMDFPGPAGLLSRWVSFGGFVLVGLIRWYFGDSGLVVLYR